MSRSKIVDDAIEIAAREGRAPEQADFMTGAVLNQDAMTAEERRRLQADLRAAELGTSTDGVGGYDDETEYLDWDDDEYGQEICPDCGKDDFFCICPAVVAPEKNYCVIVDCDMEWYESDLEVPESQVQAVTQEFLEKHRKECGCRNAKVSAMEN